MCICMYVSRKSQRWSYICYLALSFYMTEEYRYSYVPLRIESGLDEMPGVVLSTDHPLSLSGSVCVRVHLGSCHSKPINLNIDTIS